MKFKVGDYIIGKEEDENIVCEILKIYDDQKTKVRVLRNGYIGHTNLKHFTKDHPKLRKYNSKLWKVLNDRSEE